MKNLRKWTEKIELDSIELQGVKSVKYLVAFWKYGTKSKKK